MKTFSLRSICNDLLESIKDESQNKNIIKLSIDIQLPNHYEGETNELFNIIKIISLYISEILINGVIHIEMTSRGFYGENIPIQVSISGFGNSRIKTINSAQDISLLSNHTSTPIHYKATDDKLVFDFNYSLKTIETNSVQNTLPFSKKKILVVEDNEINAMVFSSFLEDWGAEPSVAINGAEAVNMAHEATYDAILMDIYMPILNGHAATKKIREFNPSIPIIALTASNDERDMHEAHLSGVNEYLLKPVSSKNLFTILERYL